MRLAQELHSVTRLLWLFGKLNSFYTNFLQQNMIADNIISIWKVAVWNMHIFPHVRRTYYAQQD